MCESSKKVNDRQICIDYAESIGILLVLVGHLCPEGGYWFRFIYLFHMPLFFYISGHLAGNAGYDGEFRRYCMKQARRLVIPYLWFCGIAWASLPLPMYAYRIATRSVPATEFAEQVVVWPVVGLTYASHVSLDNVGEFVPSVVEG